jgi:hypothetical protein
MTGDAISLLNNFVTVLPLGASVMCYSSRRRRAPANPLGAARKLGQMMSSEVMRIVASFFALLHLGAIIWP